MPTEYGKDWRVKISDGAATPVFTAIGGETSLSWKRSSQEIDLTDKDDGVYGSGTYGKQKVTFSVSGNLKLPDVGLQKAADISKAAPPEIEIQITKGATIKYRGRVGIGNFSTDHGKDGPVTFSFDMTNIGAPTVDNLGA